MYIYIYIRRVMYIAVAIWLRFLPLSWGGRGDSFGYFWWRRRDHCAITDGGFEHQ